MNSNFNNTKLTLAMIGCSGYIGSVYIQEFLKLGIKLKILARKPETLKKQFPGVDIIKGSMMNRGDVISTIKYSDAAFLITPIGSRNKKQVEINMAKVSIKAAKEIKLPHLIFISALCPKYPSGVALLDSKIEIENIIAESGIPWTSIRCGSYMEDIIGHRVNSIKKGLFLFPVNKRKEFNLTCQRDIPRFVKLLLCDGRKINKPIDFISPDNFRPVEIAKLIGNSLGINVHASGKYPLYFLLRLALPLLYLRKNRLSSIVPLIKFFNRYGYTGNKNQMMEEFPGFKMTTLKEYLTSFKINNQIGKQSTY